MNRKYLHAARSWLYAGQGRTSADAHADAATSAHDRIATETARYDDLGGKWGRVTSHHPRDSPCSTPRALRASPRTTATHSASSLSKPTTPCARRRDPAADTPRVRPVRRPRALRRHLRSRARSRRADRVGERVLGDGLRNDRYPRHRLWVGVDWDALDDPTGASATVTVAGAGVEKVVRVEVGSPVRDPAGDFVEANTPAAPSPATTPAGSAGMHRVG